MLYTILTLALATFCAGQNSSSSGTVGGYYSTSGPLEIDPNSVPLSLRASWCVGQTTNCWKICGGADANLGDAYPNTCDEQTLDWTCTCKNGNTPNISDYINTMPSYVCERWIANCVQDHPNDLVGQQGCQSVQCGSRKAPTQTGSSGSGASSASGSASASAPASTGGSSGGGSSGASASASSSGAAASQTGDSAAAAIGMNYGTGILMGGMLAVFGLAL